MKILFIRHAETQTNVDKLTHKTDDTAGLTNTGEEQAKKLGQICKNENIEIIFSSPEQRAVETAEIIAAELKINSQVLKELRERNWGEWEGKPWPEIEKVLITYDLEERYTFIPPGGESWEQMEGRLKESLNIIVNSGYNAIAVVTHEGALRGLMPILYDAPKESSFEYHFENASVKAFEYKDGMFTEFG